MEDELQDQHQTIPASSDYTKTHINGLSATYVLIKNSNDTTSDSFVIAKVVDVPPSFSAADHSVPIHIPHSYMIHNYSETPHHLCAPENIITQYRCGNQALQHRTIDISLHAYSEEEMSWYTDPESKIPPAMRLVMIPVLRCFLCGDFQSTEDDIYFENGGHDEYGYRYCAECRPYFLKSLYKAITPIIKFRQDFETWIKTHHNSPASLPRPLRPFIWVPRTRRDTNGKRIITGNAPYKYTKWRILSWVTIRHKFPRVSPYDSTLTIEKEEDSLLCEQIEPVDLDYNTISKLVPLRDIYITNLDTHTCTTYDPNMDDPLNKYSETQQIDMFESAFSTTSDTVNV